MLGNFGTKLKYSHPCTSSLVGEICNAAVSWKTAISCPHGAAVLNCQTDTVHWVFSWIIARSFPDAVRSRGKL